MSCGQIYAHISLALCGFLAQRTSVTYDSSHSTPYTLFLPERDYVTFGFLLSQFRLSSVVCLSSVPSSDLRPKFYGDRPRGTPLSGPLNARGVGKYGDFKPIEGYIS